jgi:hypothetical protein
MTDLLSRVEALEKTVFQPGRECKSTLTKCCDNGYFEAVHICQKGKPQAEAGNPFVANCTGWCPKCNSKITYDSKCEDCDNPVEGCIKDILWNYKNVAEEPENIFEHYLRELVSLARSTPPRESSR